MNKIKNLITVLNLGALFSTVATAGHIYNENFGTALLLFGITSVFVHASNTVKIYELQDQSDILRSVLIDLIKKLKEDESKQ